MTEHVAQQVSQGIEALIEDRSQNEIACTRRFALFYPTTKNGSTLVEGSDEPDPEECSGSELEFVPIFRNGETRISGYEMRKRALQENANFGQRFGEWLLAYPDKIPVRPEDWYYILLPRTVWRDRYGNLHMPCLDWDGGRLGLHFGLLDGDWGSSGGLLRPRK